MEKPLGPHGARWTRWLVTVAFTCVILAMTVAPLLAVWIHDGPGFVSFEDAEELEGLTLGGFLFILGMLCMLAMLYIPILWILVLISGNWAWLALTVLLLAGDILLAVMLWRLRRRLEK